MFNLLWKNKKVMTRLHDSYEKVKSWIINSGLIVSDEDKKNHGGVYSFYDEKKSQFFFLYPEITGYLISTLRFLFKKEPDPRFLKMAKASSDWLIDLFDVYGGIIQGIGIDDVKKTLSYSFDTGICAKGLLDYYEMSNDQIYLDYAKKFMNVISNEAINSDGTIQPFKNLQSNIFEEKSDVWYNRRGNLHIKTSMPFLQLYGLEQNPDFENIAVRICNNYKKFENDDGSLSLHLDSNQVNLHTLCYAMEGLLYAYSVTNNEEYLDCCNRCANWCNQKIENDGSIQLWFNSKFKSKATYPVAQLLRIFILLNKKNKNDVFSSNIQKLHLFLINMQAISKNITIDGGLYEEFYKSTFGWKKRLKLNSWTSMFSLQAFYWFDNYDKISFSDEIKLLY